MNIQWFPGHIARARREIKDHLKYVDIVIEVIDARCPMSSINFLSEDIKSKLHLVILNKIDLVNEYDLVKFINWLKDDVKKSVGNLKEFGIVLLDSRNNNIKRIVDREIDRLCNEIINNAKDKGIVNRQLKAMVVGMPNVGKSTFINSYVKKKVNNVANTPGVTKNLQWAKISDKLLLLDTPGVTIPKFEDENSGINLAFVGSINDDIVEKQELAFELIKKVKDRYFEDLSIRYKLKDTNKESECIDIINEIAKNIVSFKKGGDIDYEKVSNIIINDFRKGYIGKIFLEWDYDYNR